MADKSNKYGYVGINIPVQTDNQNVGVFSVNEIYDLINEGKYIKQGDLILLESQDVTSVSNVQFTNLDESVYETHLVIFNNVQPATDNTYLQMNISNNGGSSYITSGLQTQRMEHNTFGTVTEGKSTSFANWVLGNPVGNGANESVSGYLYLYGLGLSNRYSEMTFHSTLRDSNGFYTYNFGGGGYSQVQTHNAIKFSMNSGNIDTGQFSLYGLGMV